MPEQRKRTSLIKILADRQAAAGGVSCGHCGCRHSDTIATRYEKGHVIRKKKCRNCGRIVVDVHEDVSPEADYTPTPDDIERAVSRIKCEKCGKLLAKAAISKKNMIDVTRDYMQIKCPKCGFLNNIFLKLFDKSKK